MENIKTTEGNLLFNTIKKTFICDKHGPVECDITIIAGKASEAFCPLCQAEKIAEFNEKEEQERKEKNKRVFIEKMQEMNIEEEFYFSTLDSYVPQVQSQADAKKAIKELIEQKHGKVILLGSNGCGKTHLGTCAVKALGGKVYTMYEISTMIRQAYSPLARKSELEIVNELASIPMLFIDEMGRSKGSSAELNWLSYILDKRHQRRLPFILATNAHLMNDCPHGKKGCEECFENFLGNDIISRLGQDSKIIKMYDAPDYRRRK